MNKIQLVYKSLVRANFDRKDDKIENELNQSIFCFYFSEGRGRILFRGGKCR